MESRYLHSHDIHNYDYRNLQPDRVLSSVRAEMAAALRQVLPPETGPANTPVVGTRSLRFESAFPSSPSRRWFSRRKPQLQQLQPMQNRPDMRLSLETPDSHVLPSTPESGFNIEYDGLESEHDESSSDEDKSEATKQLHVYIPTAQVEMQNECHTSTTESMVVKKHELQKLKRAPSNKIAALTPPNPLSRSLISDHVTHVDREVSTDILFPSIPSMESVMNKYSWIYKPKTPFESVQQRASDYDCEDNLLSNTLIHSESVSKNVQSTRLLSRRCTRPISTGIKDSLSNRCAFSAYPQSARPVKSLNSGVLNQRSKSASTAMAEPHWRTSTANSRCRQPSVRRDPKKIIQSDYNNSNDHINHAQVYKGNTFSRVLYVKPKEEIEIFPLVRKFARTKVH